MRVNLNIPDELVKRLDEYAKKNYTSRSTVMCQSCNQFLLAQELQELFKELARVMRKLADADTVDENTLQQLNELETLCKFLNAEKDKY